MVFHSSRNSRTCIKDRIIPTTFRVSSSQSCKFILKGFHLRCCSCAWCEIFHNNYFVEQRSKVYSEHLWCSRLLCRRCLSCFWIYSYSALEKLFLYHVEWRLNIGMTSSNAYYVVYIKYQFLSSVTSKIWQITESTFGVSFAVFLWSSWDRSSVMFSNVSPKF